MRVWTLGVAIAAGLALADASVVVLALPELLVRLETTVAGVAAVVGVYTVLLAAALLPLELVQRRIGAVALAVGGALVFAGACVACARADALTPLLVARGVQGVGGAALLVAGSTLLREAGADGGGPRLWAGVAVLGAAVGPALGGALTEAFDWRAIFWAQVPVALLAVPAALRAPRIGSEHPAARAARIDRGAAAALALVSAALTAVLFALVLLLVAGWDEEPLAAALAVCVLPLGAVVGARLGGDARLRAAVGCVLVALGTASLSFLTQADLLWTIAPQLVAGLGMGLALRSLAGELLVEDGPRAVAGLLTMRHVGIAVALAVLAPLVAARLDDATERAREQGVAVVLDARLDPTTKLDLAPGLLAGVGSEAPRAGLRDALAAERADAAPEDVAELDRAGARIDGVLIDAVGASFGPAFLVAAALAALGALALAGGLRRAGLVALLPVVAAAGLALQVGSLRDRRPAPVRLADPCAARALPGTGGITGFLQDRALELLDRAACNYGSSREELVLALADEDDAERFAREHGADPRSRGGILEGLLG